MRVTLQQLMYFVAVANVRSFTRAADQVGVAQPTLSRALRALEDELGSPLINRGSVVTLTPAGEAVLPLARRMLADSDMVRTTVAEMVGLRSGRVRRRDAVAVHRRAVRRAAGLPRPAPEIAVELAEDGSQPLEAALVQGALDVALVIVPPTGWTRRCTPLPCSANGSRSPPRGHAGR